jgi:hypothetical protein
MKTQLEIGSYPAGPTPVNYTNPLPVISGGQPAGSIYQTNGNISNSPVTITFTGGACTTIVIATSSGAANLYYQLNGTAATGSTGDSILYGGAAYTYAGQALSSISILGATASGTYTITAH